MCPRLCILVKLNVIYLNEGWFLLCRLRGGLAYLFITINSGAAVFFIVKNGMFKINKLSTTLSVFTNFMLFQQKTTENLPILKRRKSSLVTLRSPKHFSVGKLKVTSLNYKSYTKPVVLPSAATKLIFKVNISVTRRRKPYLSTNKSNTFTFKTRFTF